LFAFEEFASLPNLFKGSWSVNMKTLQQYLYACELVQLVEAILTLYFKGASAKACVTDEF